MKRNLYPTKNSPESTIKQNTEQGEYEVPDDL